MAAHRELERHTLELLKAAAARGVHLSGPYPAVEPTLRRSPALVSRVEKRAAGSTHAALVLDTLIQRTAEGILVAVRPRLSEEYPAILDDYVEWGSWRCGRPSNEEPTAMLAAVSRTTGVKCHSR